MQILLVTGAIGLGGTAIAAANPFGIATAQTSNDTTTQPSTAAAPSGQVAATPAPATPAAPAPHMEDRAGGVDNVLNDLVTKGTITKEQADAIKAALKDASPKGRGPNGFAGSRGVFKMGLDTVAKTLGVTTDELRTALQSGQSIADLAKSKNIDTKVIVDAIVKEADTTIDQAVTDGKLTADQAATAKTKAAEVAQNIVDGNGPFGGGGFGPGGFGPGGFGPGGFGPGGFGPGGFGPGGPGFRHGGQPPAAAPATGQAQASGAAPATGSSTTPSITQDIFTY